MTSGEAIFLGGLQGATEFLPVSSSGHLRLAEDILGAKPPSIAFDIILHVGTLLAVVLVFRKPIWQILKGCIPGGTDAYWSRDSVRKVGLLAAACVPTAVLGLLLRGTVEGSFPSLWVGVLLLVNGVILLTSKRSRLELGADDETGWGITLPAALAIGTVQGLGVLPGISRSGITITAALLLGVRPRAAVELSFLLSIPAILGASVLTFGDMTGLTGNELTNAVVGGAVAVAVGIAALIWLVRLISKAKFHHFAWYSFAAGIVGIVYGLIQ